MNRRDFLYTAGQAAASLSLLSLQCEHTSKVKLDILTQLIQQNDARIPQLLQKQQQDVSHINFGGLRDAYGIHACDLTSAFIRDLTCALISPGSTFYQSSHILDRLECAAQFMLNRQHDDGTIDLHTTNFHSTPDTGFVMEWLCGACALLQSAGDVGLQSLTVKLEQFILKAAEALTVGGIHTPNHRWVVCMALARANVLFPNEKYVRRIDEWLGEHIDIDPDGQFTEKSTAIYSPLTDRCLITIARLLKRDELYEPVRQNLNMTLYFIHPNGEVVTDASKRQDQYMAGSLAPYYYPYRYMALLDDNKQFAAMTRWIEETRAELTANLIFFLEEEDLKNELPLTEPLPTNYDKIFSHSNLARIRRQDISATILADNFTVFSFCKGEAVLHAIRLASAFFGKGQFKGEKLEFKDGAYVMSQKLDGPYYQPFPKDGIPKDGSWKKMDKEKRHKSEIQTLESVVSIREHDAVFSIDIDIKGTDNVPVALELAFRHGGKLKRVCKAKSIIDAYFLKEGMGLYTFRNQTIEFGPGRHEHQWTQLRGAEDKLDAMCVYVTGFTPLTWTITMC